MKAVVAAQPGAAGNLRWTEAPEPTIGPADCLVRVEACGVCMHDVLVRNGSRTKRVEFPVIPGHEVVGCVESVGDDVSEFAKGDRVVTVQREYVCGACRDCRSGHETKCSRQRFLGDVGLNGGYSELVRIAESSLVHVPLRVSTRAVAVASCVLGTELNAVRDVAGVRLGETVLVTGAGGGVGLHAVQLARVMGARVIAVTTSIGKRDVILEAGANEVVVSERGADFSRAVSDLTDGCGCDVVIENVGSAIFASSIKCAARYGRFVLVGEVVRREVSIDLRDLRDRAIRILTASSTSRNQLVDVIGLISSGLVRPFIERELPMSAAAEAHRQVEAGAATGRILLTPDGSA